MNLNLINLDPAQWTRTDWQDAYAQYCKDNMFGPKTKKEYYDMVIANFAKIAKTTPRPLSDELKRSWTIGKRNARLWAKKRGCDMSGQMLSDVRVDNEDRSTREIAERAEDIAIDTKQKLAYLIERVRK